MIYLELFLTFFKIGAVTFGGGYAMIPLMSETVLTKNWLTLEQLMNFIAISESTPGPFAVNMSTYIGTQYGGIFGGVCATVGVVLPSFIIILIVAKCYVAFQKSTLVRGCMNGLKPAAIGLIASAVISMTHSTLFPNGVSVQSIGNWFFLSELVILGVAGFLIHKKKHPLLVMAVCAAMGILLGYLGM